MRITVSSTLLALVDHFTEVMDRIDDELDKAVSTTAREGNRAAVRNARRTAGDHGKHYAPAFSVERLGNADYVYGPNAAMPQGGMSFEEGSRNQPPHRDIERSRDVVRDRLPGRVHQAVGRALG